MTPRPPRVVALLLGAVVAVGAGLGAPVAADSPAPDPRTVWFGPALDWQRDSASDFDRRLGADASLFGGSVGYPLSPTSELLVHDLSAQTAQARAVAVLTVEPTDLRRLTDQDAVDLAEVVAQATDRDGSFVLLRFAPEMNAPWTPWGRRPLTYVRAFRTLADAVHDATDAAAMVWSPAYGGGYPFAGATGATGGTGATGAPTGVPGSAPALDERNLPYLDTDGDGAVTDADDPYGPYYPGDEHVDWVGLTMLRPSAAAGTDALPADDELDTRFKERFGYEADGRRATFYVRFAGSRDTPFLLTTGALHDPARTGTEGSRVTAAWLEQVTAAVASRPLLDAVQWVEQPPGAITDDPAVASASRAALEQGSVTLGPLDGVGTDRTTPAETSDVRPDAGPPPAAAASVGDGLPAFAAGVLVTLAVVLVAGVAALRVRRRRAVPTWLR